MSRKPGTHRRMPFKRSEGSKNRRQCMISLGCSFDKQHPAKYGTTRRRKFGGDYYTVCSLRPCRDNEEVGSLISVLEEYGPYKIRVVTKMTGIWVYARLAHIGNKSGHERYVRRY